MLNKVPLIGNTHKVGLCIDQLMTELCPEAHENLALYFPRSNGSVFINSVFRTTLWTISTSNHQDWL